MEVNALPTCCWLGLTCLPGLAAQAGMADAPAATSAREASLADEWRWARSALPRLSGYQPLDLEPVPVGALLDWAPEGKTILVYDWDCRPIRLSRFEGTLAGDVDEKTTIEHGIKRVEASTVRYGAEISYLGSGWTEYERDARGRWVEAGAGAPGCLNVPPGTLNRVTRTAAWYAGAIVFLKAVCETTRRTTSPCSGGGQRTCESCAMLGLEVESHSPGMGMYRRGRSGVGIEKTKPIDCSQPCPEDPSKETLEHLNRILAKRRFLTTRTQGTRPALFRSRKTCMRYRSKHR